MIHLDEAFFAGAAVVVFILLVWRPVSRFVTKGLDQRTHRIQTELDEAVRLKEEAQSLCFQYQQRQQETEEECLRIVAHAHEEMERLRETAAKDLETAIARRTDIAMQKIANCESTLANEMKSEAIHTAIAAVQFLIRDHLGTEQSNQLINQSIANLDKKFH
jgi:F-type H+-transporting ATPase subunit b